MTDAFTVLEPITSRGRGRIHYTLSGQSACGVENRGILKWVTGSALSVLPASMICCVASSTTVPPCNALLHNFTRFFSYSFFRLHISAQYLKRLKCKSALTLAVILSQILSYFVSTKPFEAKTLNLRKQDCHQLKPVTDPPKKRSRRIHS